MFSQTLILRPILDVESDRLRVLVRDTFASARKGHLVRGTIMNVCPTSSEIIGTEVFVDPAGSRAARLHGEEVLVCDESAIVLRKEG